MSIDILHRYTGAVVYSSAAATDIAEAMIEAVRAKAYLGGAYLGGVIVLPHKILQLGGGARNEFSVS